MSRTEKTPKRPRRPVTEPVHFRIPADEYERLQVEAAEEIRPFANLVAVIFDEGLRARRARQCRTQEQGQGVAA